MTASTEGSQPVVDPAHLGGALEQPFFVPNDPATVEDDIAGIPAFLVPEHGHQRRFRARPEVAKDLNRVDPQPGVAVQHQKVARPAGPASSASRSAPAVPRSCAALIDVGHIEAPAAAVADVVAATSSPR